MKGDFAELQRLAGRVATLGGELIETLRDGLTTEARTQIAEGFAEQRTPYGDRWAKSYRARVEGGQTLRDSGRLANSLTTMRTPTGFEVGTNAIYAAVHQYGATIRPVRAPALRFRLPGPVRGGRRTTGGWVTAQSVRIPQRQFMPEKTLGPIWGEAFNELADDLIRDHLDQ